MKQRTFAIGLAVVIAGGVSMPLFAGWRGWQNDATIKGITFEKAKVESSGLIIGKLRTNTVIAGRPCRKGWVHLHTNGVPAGFTASEDIALARFTVAADTWVIQDTAGIVKVCAFSENTEVLGHVCRGTGGPTGVHAAFYPDGALKEFFLVRPTRIDGVPCDTGLVRGRIELHNNGRLKSCRLSESFTRDCVTFRKGARIDLDPDGRVMPNFSGRDQHE
jgi:hypothetical protein